MGSQKVGHDWVTFTFSLSNSFMKTNTASVNSYSRSLGFAEQRQKNPQYPCRMKAWTRDKSGAGSLQRQVRWRSKHQVQRPESTCNLPDTDRNTSRYSSELQFLWILGMLGEGRLFENFIFCFLLNFLFCIGVQPINNAVTVSGEQRRDSATHIRVSVLPQTPLPARLPHCLEQSSMCYTAGPCWLPILNTAVCTCPSQTPELPLPAGNHKLIFCESLSVL